MTPDRDTLIAWYGTDEEPPDRRPLQAGPLGAVLVDGGLRDIRLGGIEVLRAIAYVVRDRDWGTYAPVIEGLAVDADAGGFTVRYTARVAGPATPALELSAVIVGTAEGNLRFEVTATPEADFETNRCGFCVLHPIRDLAGRPVSVEHVDGRVVRTVLPDLIEPWQPFKAVRAVTHTVSPGLDATCRMEGDVFEMEDQRAWSDASYKTYVRPLERPWPYVLPGGDAQRQIVTLSLSGTGPAPAAAAPAAAVAVTLGDVRGRLPGFGLVVTPAETAAVLEAADRLRALAPQSLLFHFDPTAGHDRDALRGFAAVRQRHAAEAVLECIVPGRDDPGVELDAIAADVAASGLRLDMIVVSPSVDRQSTPPGSAWPACPPLEDVYAAARRAFPGLRLGGGMVSYFTELNRKRPPVASLDVVSHATCPIVHAADDHSVMETLEALPFIARSVRAIVGDKPYRIGPSTIGMRQNPYGSRTMDNPAGRRVAMAEVDPRQKGLFAAAWMIGYAAALGEADLETVTGAALTGAFGLIDGRRVRPAFHAARLLASLAGRERRVCRSAAPDRLLGVAANDPRGGTTLALANLTATPQPVRIQSPGQARWRGVVLDHHALDATADGTLPPDHPMADDLILPPYAVAILRCQDTMRSGPIAD